MAYRGDVREREPRALRREVCLVPQLPALIEGTVAENIEFAALLNGSEPDPDGLLRLSGLDPSTPSATPSGSRSGNSSA